MKTCVIRALLIEEGPMSSGSKLALLAEQIGATLFRNREAEEITIDRRRRAFDIVLFDITGVDTVDGLDRVRWLHDRVDDVPIVLITDVDDPGFAHAAVQNGAQDVLPAALLSAKSLERTMLISIERSRLQQHRILHSREDPLTGLGNRLLIEERFDRAIARADRQATLVGLVSIELDHVDWLVEHEGAEMIDRLLPLVGDRLVGEVRETDTIARTRDTGFTCLVEGLAAINDISALVDRLPRLLAEPFSINGRDITVTVSVGVAVAPFHGRQFQAVNTMAEAAMLDVATLNGDGLLMLPLPSIAERFVSSITA